MIADNINPSTPETAKNQNSNFIFLNIEKQMVPYKRSAEEVSFEWSTIGFRRQT